MAKFTKKSKIAVVTAALVLGIGGTAFAYWTQLGSGTSGAGTGTTTSVVVNQTNTVTDLYPGGTAQALSGNFDNPNTAAVTVGAVTATVTGTSVSGCLPAWYAITGSSDPAVPVRSYGHRAGCRPRAGRRSECSTPDPPGRCKRAVLTLGYEASGMEVPR